MKKNIFPLLCLLAIPAFAKNADDRVTVDLKVTEQGFQPNKIDVGPGKDLTLKVTRTSDQTCASEIQIPDKKISQKLPLNKLVEIHVGKLEKGEVRFGCGMNMMEGGKIYVK